MARLGIDRQTGLVYEGRQGPTHPLWPAPVITQATLVESPADIGKVPGDFDQSPFTWILVESSFDPVSRIRRGRLFQNFGNSSEETVETEPHPARGSRAEFVGHLRRPLTVFIECTALLLLERSGEGKQLALGQKGGISLWRILQAERIITGDVLVTLRAESAFNILPSINKTMIPPESLEAVESAINRVLDAAYKELPTSVVDQCRNAACVVASRWMQAETNSLKADTKDLGAVIQQIKQCFGDGNMVALRSALEIISRLHPRGKDNERHRLQLRDVAPADAEYAVSTLGFILRELKWAV